jgi:hypothetical protein
MEVWHTVQLFQQTMLKLYLPTKEEGAVIRNKRVIFTEALKQTRETYKPRYFVAKCSTATVYSSRRHPLSRTELVQMPGTYRGRNA